MCVFVEKIEFNVIELRVRKGKRIGSLVVWVVGDGVGWGGERMGVGEDRGFEREVGWVLEIIYLFLIFFKSV